ncbi:TIGR02646 family protein [Acinetobacter sp. CIP-A165]|uniref:hypothetical protein n=1 Tax=Acinetobacter sp. CIP-A165 TaxID=40373 RepID=UPI0002CD710E|nr:hypothetical protein [Acinetobacter sp. CIP-A165]ENU31204.1 TIGR02646 family protein [Acinetobacter sp. CIP-A165]
MFSVSRPNTVPKSLTGTNKDYRSEEVVVTLKQMFHGKCYLCERANILDIEVEHLDPHRGDVIKKFNWNNLFYSCSRCNNIKSHTHTNIVDCSLINDDVSRYLILDCPITNNKSIKVTVKESGITSQQPINFTVMLLDECYNNTSTGIRGISRSELIKDIQRYSFQLQKLKNELLFPTEPLAQSEIDLKIEKLKAMCSPQFSYSAFWKWAITLDEDLSQLVGNVF